MNEYTEVNEYEELCEHCDGYGYHWNNGDDTNGQFALCEVCKQGDPEGPYECE